MSSDSNLKIDASTDKPEVKKPEIDLSELLFFLYNQARVISREVINYRKKEQYYQAQFAEGTAVAYRMLAERLMKGYFNKTQMKEKKKNGKCEETGYKPKTSRKDDQG